MSPTSGRPEEGHRGPPPKPAKPDQTKFFGSQVGGQSVINYGYTDMPLKLMIWDTRYFFVFAWALPWIVWPIRPCEGGDFDELAFTRPNMWCIFVHTILVVLQIAFIIALPWVLLFPAWIVIVGMVVFFGCNSLLCRTLNGSTITFNSDPEFAPALEEHEHEQWIFMNGVAVGEAWLKSNINRLALTFKRPIIGVHNQTSGIIFDVVECLVQRNFGLATRDVREAYKIVKDKLYNPKHTKVIFILHSQGGIEGGLVLDWLLQELPQDLLAKLEVYTFGNAANHFNNPHRHAESQEVEERNPGSSRGLNVEIPETVVEVPAMTHSPTEIRTPAWSRQPTQLRSNGHTTPSIASRDEQNSTRTRHSKQVSVVPASDRAIGHVEHYAHTTDFVALWGVLHFVTTERTSPQLPRFIGRVFSRTSSLGGHQFSQHYLNGMFPLARDAETGKFTGCAESNEFMDSVVEPGAPGSEEEAIREGIENNWARLRQDSELVDDEDGVSVRGSFYEGDRWDRIRDGKVRVKHLSRLWLYRNGRSPPPEVPTGLEWENSSRVATF